MKKYVTHLALGLLAYAPFHAVISTWLTSNFGNEVLFKGFKDGLLFVLFVLSVWVYRAKVKELLKLPVGKIAALYAVLVLGMAALVSGQNRVQIVGVVTLLRPIAAFIIGYLVLSNKARMTKRIFLAGALCVSLFGFLQATVLPKDILTHVGYGQSTIPAYFTIDNNQDLVRIISTMRGPNPLGAYMVVVVSMLVSFGAYLWRKAGNEKESPYLGIALIVGLIALYSSGSRSAWLGLLVSGFIVVWLWSTKKFRTVLMVGLVGFVLLGALGLRVYKDTAFVSQTILHTDRNEWSSVNSDDARRANTRAAKRDVFAKPVGYGTGSAGIASTYGKKPRIIENQYLLIAYQLGIVGAVLFLVLLVLMTAELWKVAHNSGWWPRGLVAAWVGLMLTAVFVPAFDDDALATILFMLAGATIYYTADKAHVKVRVDERTKTKHQPPKSKSVR
jgi:O-antigen ligase